MVLFCAKTIVRGSHSIELAHLKTEERRMKLILAIWQFFSSVLFLCIFTLLGVLVVPKTFEDEWYIVNKDYKFTAFEIFLGLSYIVSVISLHIESTDSMITITATTIVSHITSTL